jgi:hypothetical protein
MRMGAHRRKDAASTTRRLISISAGWLQLTTMTTAILIPVMGTRMIRSPRRMMQIARR